MKTVITVICIFAFMAIQPLSAQEQGIQFDKSKNWKEVVEKATRENKYIYMDVMATWCPPCQMMVKNVFTQKEVGDFYNENFICVKLQTDKTAKDDEYVKSWYADAERIDKEFNIRSLPTSLYFNPKGELVHVVVGAIPLAKEFVEIGKMALDENQQIFTRLRKYEQGEKDVEFLYALSVDLKYNVGDMKNAVKVANTFWQTITPEEQLLAKGVRYAADFLVNVDDTLFNFFLTHEKEIDAILGKRAAESKVIRLIEKKYMAPLVKDTVNQPDWDGVYNKLAAKYPQKKDQIKVMVLNDKLVYTDRYHFDKDCADALMELLKQPDVRSSEMLVRIYAHRLGIKAYTKDQRTIALQNMERLLDEKNVRHLLDYAEVLFLDEQDGKGRKYVNKALDIAEEGSDGYKRAEQMKKDHAKDWKVLKAVMNEIN